MSPEHLVLADLAPQPWKNGGGLTRELAVSPRGATIAGFDWRFSVARLDADARFSRFAGVDRWITLLHGAGMMLRSADGRIDQRVTAIGEPFAFPGDADIAAQLVDGPCEDLNVMVRRGRWEAEVTTIDAEQRLEGADAGLLVGLAGAWSCRAAEGRLEPLQAWLWRTAMPPTVVRATEPGSRALLVRLTALCR